MIRSKVNPMAATWTKAARVQRSSKAGRPRQVDREVDAETAILECRILYRRLLSAMEAEGIGKPAGDLQVGLILVGSEGGPPRRLGVQSAVVSLESEIIDLPRACSEASGLQADFRMRPFGPAVLLTDREAGADVLGWSLPWLVGSNEALDAELALRRYRERKAGFTMGI